MAGGMTLEAIKMRGTSVGGSASARKARTLGFGAVILALPATPALAFPLIDPYSQGPVPTGSDLSTADQQDLSHHLQLVNGPLVAPPGGWAFQPRIDMQFLLTDNVYQVNSPRQWDFVTYFAPGFSLAGDLTRLKANFTFQPTLTIYANASKLNALTQNYSGLATATLVDDLMFVDLRAISSVGSVYGGLGGIGGVGSNAVANYTAANVSGLGNGYGLNTNNLVQYSALSISPYLYRRLGDYGNVRLGISAGLSYSESINGFVASPFPTGSGNSQQSYYSIEEYFHYDTGDALNRIQYGFDANLQQAQTNTGSGYYPTVTGLQNFGALNYGNNSYTLSNKVSYRVNDTIQVFVTGGYQYVNYSDQTFRPINGPIWSVGATLTPGSDTSLTTSYGFNNGYYSFNMSGYYNATARTTLNTSYYSSLGTQLQYLQNQLGLATGPTLVNGQNGGQLFVATNQFGPQSGVFRFDTFSIGVQTSLDRDIISANFSWSKSTQQGVNSAPPSTGTTFNVQWTHALQEDLTLTTAAAYNTSNNSSQVTTFNPGNSHAIIASAALQYQLSPTLGASVRYSFFDRISEVNTYSIYQNMLVLGISKTF